MSKYIDFTQVDDYCTYLKDNRVAETNIEFTETHGKVGRFNIYPISIFATLTAQVGNSIACCGVPILNTTSFHFDAEKQRLHDLMNANFEKVKAGIEQRGFSTRRGKLTNDKPGYLGA